MLFMLTWRSEELLMIVDDVEGVKEVLLKMCVGLRPPVAAALVGLTKLQMLFNVA